MIKISQKMQNYYYFCIINYIIASIIAIFYWFGKFPSSYLYKPELTDWLAIAYISSMHIIILALIVSIASLIVLPAIYLSGKKKFIIQSILTAIFFGVLYLDIRVFQSSFLHIININITDAINILTNKHYIFSQNKIIAYIGILILLVLIYKINIWVNKTTWFQNNKIGTKFIVMLTVFVITPQIIYYTANKTRKQQLLTYIQYLPFCYSRDTISAITKNTYKTISSGKIQYPLQPLQTTDITNPPNVLIIAMDAWRADCFNADDAPNLWKFAEQGKIFNKHYSGCNGTVNGLFSLFYGIPATYINKMLQLKQQPLLIERLQQLNYQINFFAGDCECNRLILDLVYNKTKNLSLINNQTSPYQIDDKLIENWLSWYNNINKKQPWFSFIFYNALHGLSFHTNNYNYKQFVKTFGKQQLINDYKKSVHYIDNLALKILDQLKKNNDLTNTIVIITADHGCEFDDCNQGQWGYGSNFTKYQIQVPFAIIIPKSLKKSIHGYETNFTNHYDLVPTLMKNFLGINNDITDYCIGSNLLGENTVKKWSFASTLTKYGYCSAIIEDNETSQLTSLNSRSLDNFNQVRPYRNISTKYINQAIEYMTRFIIK